MDIVEIIQKKIDALGKGSFTLGLKAVLIHIETAVRHLQRGQESYEDAAFTKSVAS